MIFIDVSFEKWAKKYNLYSEFYHCDKCKKHFETTVPIMTKDSVGLQSIIHECGPEFYLAILKPRTKEAIEFWNRIV